MRHSPLTGWGRFRRETSRAALVVRVLARYGFAELSDRLGLKRLVRLRDRLLHKSRTSPDLLELATPERFSRALAELGPTFVKLGQLLSTRPDLMPPEYLESLATLQDRVPGISRLELEAVVRQEMGDSPRRLFEEFAGEPLAAASLAQVHLARLAGAGAVAVKVQRPGVRDVVETDLGLLRHIADLAGRLPEYSEYDLAGLHGEFARTIRAELDYVHEGHNCDICRHNFSRDEEVRIPHVHWSRTTRRVLTLDFIEGVKVTDTDALQRVRHDRCELARRGCRVYLAMVFEHGFFQADPHPGNLIVTPEGRIGIVDYGMFARVDEDTRDCLVDLLLAVWHRRADEVVRVIDRLSPIDNRQTLADLRGDIGDVIDRYHGTALNRIQFAALAREFLVTLRRYRLRMPRSMVNLLRGLATAEGTGLMVDPEFDLFGTMQPYLARLARRQLGPLGLARTASRSYQGFVSLLRHLPADLREILALIRRGTLRLKLDQSEFSEIASRIERSNARLSGAIVLAALIVGASLLVFAAPPDLHTYVPIIGISAYVIAGLIGLWLLISILRGTK